MDKELRETTNLGVEIMNSKTTFKVETWSRGTNSRLLFDVNVMLNLSNITQHYVCRSVPESLLTGFWLWYFTNLFHHANANCIYGFTRLA